MTSACFSCGTEYSTHTMFLVPMAGKRYEQKVKICRICNEIWLHLRNVYEVKLTIERAFALKLMPADVLATIEATSQISYTTVSGDD